ncbi:MAG: 30S ribosomal protein S18 [Chloroflexi bacterium ADurb.Bin325]|nr:MAG: 30S ribosomal protein S18 [Chloroflexi bacterium ADurb.Bin325]
MTVEEREEGGQPAAGGASTGAPERSERRPWSREGRAGGGPRGRFQRRRVCAFCVDKVDTIDYKDVNTLRRFVSDQGQINSRRRTGTCARHQRLVTRAVKRARYLALLPYTAEHVRRFS